VIVWLASYPRSGNTLLRIVLHRLYGAKDAPRQRGGHAPARLRAL